MSSVFPSGSLHRSVRIKADPPAADRQRGVKSSLAVPRCHIRPRAPLEQEPREGDLSAADRDHQRRGSAALCVDRCARSDEHAADLDVPLLGGEQHGCEGGRRTCMDGRRSFKEPCDHVAMTFRRRPHQRCLAGLGGLGVNQGAAIEEHLDDLGVARERGGHEGRFTLGPERRVDVRACLEQPGDDRRVPVLGGQHQRRYAVIVGRVDVAAGADEKVDGLDVVPVRRPLERGRPVALGHADICLRPHQRAERRPVLLLGRRDDATIRFGRPASGGHNAAAPSPPKSGCASCWRVFIRWHFSACPGIGDHYGTP